MDLWELLNKMWQDVVGKVKPGKVVTIGGVPRPRAINASDVTNLVFVNSSEQTLYLLTGGGYTFGEHPIDPTNPFATSGKVAKIDKEKMAIAGWVMEDGWRKHGIELHVAMLNLGRFIDDPKNGDILWADGLLPFMKVDPEKMKAAGFRLGKKDLWYLSWDKTGPEGTGGYVCQIPMGGPLVDQYKSYASLYGKPWDGVTNVGMSSKYVEPLDSDLDA